MTVWQSQDLKSIVGLQIESHWTCSQTFYFSLASPLHNLIGPEFIFQKQSQSREIPLSLLYAWGERIVALEPPVGQSLGKDVMWRICLKLPSHLPWVPSCSSTGSTDTIFPCSYPCACLQSIYPTF